MRNIDAIEAENYDGHVHFRAPSDLMPKVHKHARRRGMTSASWLRSIIVAALDEDIKGRRYE